MKILLDENMPAKVHYDFGADHQVFTVKDMQWVGQKNGELLQLAARHGFEVLITLDKNLRHRQNLDKSDLKFILLLAVNNKPQTIQPYIEKIKNLLALENLPKLTQLR